MSKNIVKAVQEYESLIQKEFEGKKISKKPNPKYLNKSIPAAFPFPVDANQLKGATSDSEIKKWRFAVSNDKIVLEFLDRQGKSAVQKVEVPTRQLYEPQVMEISSTSSMRAIHSQDQLAMTSASANSLRQSLMGRKIENVSWQDFSFHRFVRPPTIRARGTTSSKAIPPSAPPAQPKSTSPTIGTTEGFESRRTELAAAVLGSPLITALSPAERNSATEILNGIEAALFAKDRIETITPEAITESAYGTYCTYMMDGLVTSGILSELVAAAVKIPQNFRNDFYNLLFVPSFPPPSQWATGIPAYKLSAFLEGTYDDNNAKWSTYELEIDDLIVSAWTAKLPSFKSAADNALKAAKDIAKQPQEKEPPKEKDFDFLTFEPGSWNLGLRIIHRQEWRPIGVQRGEIVKTIPLGPKQVEKVSSKVIKKSKLTQTSETIRATESTTETTDTTKDSSDVVQEASKSFGWHIEAEASANAGWAEASIKGGAEGKEAESSKSTNNHLSESMQKTANKMRNESKVVVSMETETTFENERSSEIQNPNDDIAVTYYYSKMQRQYEIFTSLGEIHSVIFIAEDMPRPRDVNVEWVRKHDWMIAKVLLDESFRETLNFISSDELADEKAATKTGGFNEKLEEIFGSAKTSMENITSKPSSISLASVDVLQEAQRAYRENFKEHQELLRMKRIWDKKINRFLDHLRRNILHYMRTIWSQEDADQRMLRYAAMNKTVPTVWKFKPQTGTPQPIPNPVDPSTFVVAGTFEPDVSDPKTLKPLQDLINPAGPIGYVGNYAVFYINAADLVRDSNSRIFEMLSILKYPYSNYPEQVVQQTGNTIPVYPDPAADAAALIDPAMRPIVRENAVPTTFTNKLKREIIDFIPTLRNKYGELTDTQLAEVSNPNSTTLDPINFADYYHTYLFRKAYTRRLLIDTNNLMIDILKGEDSVLEEFKANHRAVDVDKARAELQKMTLENSRRSKLLELGKLADPDIDKVVAYTDPNAAPYIVVDDFDNDDEPEDGPQP